MKLDDYLNANGISGADFADRIGVNAATVYRIRTGRVFPHQKTIRAIIAATEGAVTVNDLLLSQQQPIRKKENL
jgi:transcriptional regulator with XRE-family HTH domain